MNRRRLGLVTAILVPLGLAVFLVLRLMSPGVTSPSPGPGTPRPAAVKVCAHAGCYIGPALAVTNRASLDQFTQVTGTRVNIAESYQVFGKPLPVAWAQYLLSRGILPLIQLDPRHVSVKAIAAGKYDTYLTAYAKQADALGDPIALSFAHEMNGNWYSWGYQHVRPAVFVAAWRHIHDVFARSGASRVIWVWTVNRYGNPRKVSPARWWWPGGAYVTWVGINGKYGTGASTFGTVFTGSLAHVSRFAGKSVLLTETGVIAGPRQPAQIANLFAGMRRDKRIIGMLWLNTSAVHGDWRLQGKPAADAVFRREAAQYR